MTDDPAVDGRGRFVRPAVVGDVTPEMGIFRDEVFGPWSPSRGTVWVNAYGSLRPEVPFGGFGESGLGRELGAHALTAYTEPKSLFVAL